MALKNVVINGVGYLILKDPTDSKISLRVAKLQDLTFTLDVTTEDVFGGDSMFPFEQFVREKKIDVSATNAEFDLKIIDVLQGATTKTEESAIIHEFEEGTEITETEGVVDTYKLNHYDTFVEDSLTMVYADTGEALTEAAGASPAEAGEFVVSSGGIVTFHANDVGKSVIMDYKWTSANSDVTTIKVDDIPGSFELVHVGKFSRKDGTIGGLQTTLYKVRPKGTLDINFTRASASTHRLEFSVLNPERADKKMAEFVRF